MEARKIQIYHEEVAGNPAILELPGSAHVMDIEWDAMIQKFTVTWYEDI